MHDEHFPYARMLMVESPGTQHFGVQARRKANEAHKSVFLENGID
jgi:hypothetical protein